MRTIKLLFFIIAATLVVSCTCCNSHQNCTNPEEKSDVAEVELTVPAYVGTFEGVLGEADKEGMQVKLVLNQDLTYSFHSTVINSEPLEGDDCSGVYEVAEDGIITVIRPSSGAKSSWKLVEGGIAQVDSEGAICENTILKKTVAPAEGTEAAPVE